MKNLYYNCLFLLIVFAKIGFGQTSSNITHSANSNFENSTGRIWAVIAGISKYKYIDTLNFAHKDAESFRIYLNSVIRNSPQIENISYLLNNDVNMSKLTSSLDGLIDSVKAGDKVFIFFSGHGGQDIKKIDSPTYLLTNETVHHSYASSALPVSYLQSVISTLSVINKAKVFVFLDACRAGNLSGRSIGDIRLMGEQVSRQISNEVKLLACQFDEVSYEGKQWGDGHGAFTHFLIKGLEGAADVDPRNNQVTLYELELYLKKSIKFVNDSLRQTPFKVGSDYIVLSELRYSSDKFETNIKKKSGEAKNNDLQINSFQSNKKPTKSVLEDKTRQNFRKALKERKLLSAIKYFEELKMSDMWTQIRSSIEREFLFAFSEYFQEQIVWYYRISDLAAVKDSVYTIRDYIRQKRINKLAENNKLILFQSDFDSIVFVSTKAVQIIPQFKRNFIGTRTHSNAYFLLGLNEKQGEYAINYFSDAIKLDTTLAHNYIELAGVHIEHIQYHIADKLLKKGAEIAPNWLLARKMLKQLHGQNSDHSLVNNGPIEVPILKTGSAYVVEYKPPYAKIRVNFDNDYKDYYSLIDCPDSVLVFSNRDERRQYETKRQKAERDLQRFEERKQKALATNKPFKEETPAPLGKVLYRQNRQMLRPGLEIELAFLEYRYNKKFVMQEVTILTDLSGPGTIVGKFEQLMGDVATVDGRAVRLKPGSKLIGEKGYKGQSFSSFSDMERGMEMKLRGQRQNDGTLLVESGTVSPDEFTQTDQKLLTTLRLTKKMSLDGREVAFGNAKFNLLRDETINAYIGRIGRKLVPDYIRKLPKDHPAYINFNFFVVIDTTFNACAYPDGSVFVHTQLLNELENEAQLAAVLGHEIAHVTYRHSRKEYENGQSLAIGKAAFSTAMVSAYGIESADLANSIAAFGGAALSSSYSRDLENQADRIGLNYIYEAGYDPREAPKLWERLFQRTPDVPTRSFGERMLSQAGTFAMLAKQGGTPTTDQVQTLAMEALKSNAISSIYASHPSAGKRYKNLNALIIQNYQDAELDKLSKGEPEFKAIQKRLRRLVRGLPATDEDEEIRPVGSVASPAAKAISPARLIVPTKATKKRPKS